MVGGIRIARAEGGEQAIMLLQRLLGHAAVEHQAEDVQVDVPVIQRLPGELVVRNLQNLIMKMRIRPRKTGIAAVAAHRRLTLFHVGCGILDALEFFRSQPETGLPRALRFEHQPEPVQIVELLRRELGRGRVADQMSLAHQSLALKPREGVAHRGLGDIQLSRQLIDGKPCPWQNLQGHDALIDLLVNAFGNAQRPREPAFVVVIRRYSHLNLQFCILDMLRFIPDMISNVKYNIIYDLIWEGWHLLVSVGYLREVAEKALLAQKATPPNARLQADLLIEAELRGLPSHGIQRLPRLIERLRAGLAHPTADGKARKTASGAFAIDGERGLGPVVMMRAIERLAAAAPRQGITLASIRNANHIGMLAYYVEAAAKRGLIAIVMTTSEALVHPYGGTEAMLGTNPIAIGIPTGAGPFVLDIATSCVSMGKIHHHALTGTPIPDDWAVNADGHRTTDPEEVQAGAIAPFGGAKGYGLGLGVELLVASLAGSAFAPEVGGTLDATTVANKGDIVILIDPAAGERGPSGLAAYLDRLRASRATDPSRPVAVPGDGMRARRGRSLAEGIDLPDPLHEELLALSIG